LFEEFEDFTNVNPLENGKPDLRYEQIAIVAISTTADAASKSIIEGPYNRIHFRMIKEFFPDLDVNERNFWNLFNITCATKADEGGFSKERLYMNAVSEIIRLNRLEDDDLDFYDDDTDAYDVNSGQVEQLKGKGVNARYS
jgi:hypothetical protein